MRTLKSLFAAVLIVMMLITSSISAFAAYEDKAYDDVDEMYNTTLSTVNTTYIKFVDSLGIISATKTGNFMPDMKITRGEALKIAYRMLHNDYDELADYAQSNTDFDEDGDQGDINDVSLLKPYLAWAVDYQLINSKYVPNMKFEPTKEITGEEFITLMTKVVGLLPGEESSAADVELFQAAVLEGSEVEAASTSINREQAAVIVARTMVYDPNGAIADDTFIEFADFDGNSLNSLSTKIYGCTVTDLTVRATRQTPLNYEVTKDVLLSNGSQFSTDVDFSKFIGYPIRVIFCDTDASGTFTEDETIITYELLSPVLGEFSLSDVKIVGDAYFTASSSTGFYVYSQALMYLNGDIWPADEIYKINNLPTYGKPSDSRVIANRPNLKFTFVQNSMANVDVVLAEEWIPGKVMAVTDNYISIQSYYTGELLTYEDCDLVLNQMVNPKSGDYVNFYESKGKLHLCEGTTVNVVDYRVNADGTIGGKNVNDNNKSVAFASHLYYKEYTPIDSMSGEAVAVLDITGTTLLALEEKIATEETAIEIVSAKVSDDGATVDVVARDWNTGAEVKLNKVETMRITNVTGAINPGDIYTYNKTAGGKVNLYAINRLELAAIEADDYFIVGGEEKYLKAADYTDDSDATIADVVTLLVDHNKLVWAAYTK